MPRPKPGPERYRPCDICQTVFLPRLEGKEKGWGRFCTKKCKGEFFRRKAVAETSERFWAQVNKTGGCWLWCGSVTRDGGHGQFRGTTAHRFCYEMLVGPVPDGMDVCHNCPGGDNPLCVRPEHMFLGTRQDNMDDYFAKKRARRGA